jgi:transposase
VSWAASLETRFTEAFEELVAYLARATDKTTVSALLGIAWRSVGAIVERVVERHLDSKRLDGLVFIGIEEFSYRKRHHYLTVVIDHLERRAVWGAARVARLASRSRLKPFARLARTLREHRDGLLAYVSYRLTNGVVEGFNNRLHMVARRAFGVRLSLSRFPSPSARRGG